VSASNLPAGPNESCAHGIPLMLGCFFCEQAIQRHEQRLREERQQEADRRIVEYHQAMYGPSPDDVWAEEPEDICRKHRA